MSILTSMLFSEVTQKLAVDLFVLWAAAMSGSKGDVVGNVLCLSVRRQSERGWMEIRPAKCFSRSFFIIFSHNLFSSKDGQFH